MRDILFRCSSIGKLMTEPMSIDASLRTPDVEAIIRKTKRSDEEKEVLATLKKKTLSETAKTYIRELVSQEIFGVDFDIGGKPIEKGIEVEAESIGLLNRVRGLRLQKNTRRLDNGFITGECDLFDATRRRGHDIKSSWSIATFPILPSACVDQLYEWQMRGYMMLWDADEWEVNYCLVDTPERLLGYEPLQLHIVSHIPEHMRLTTWTVTRDAQKEAAILEKVELARAYFREVVREFDQTHPDGVPDWHTEAPVANPRPAPVAPRAEPSPKPSPATPAALPELF